MSSIHVSSSRLATPMPAAGIIDHQAASTPAPPTNACPMIELLPQLLDQPSR